MRLINYHRIRRILIATTLAVSMAATCAAQRENHCGTRSPERLIHVSPQGMQRSTQVNSVMVRLFVHICAESNGSNPVTTAESVIAVLEHMENFFEPYGICFVLVGFGQVNNSALLSVDDDDEDLLLPYLISDAINIFVHDQLFIDGEAFGGRSWDIPNTYLSITNNNFVEANDLLLAHELGHCFGLYHTHQGGNELVARTGPCSNCQGAGDLLCDTPADPYGDGDLDEHVVGCEYSDFLEDGCGNNYAPDPLNIMSYAPGGCWEYFTAGQGSRMLGMILDDSDLLDCVSPNNVLIGPATNVVISFGWRIYTAENDISVIPQNYELVSATRGFFGAPEMVFLPGVRFAPSSGYVHVRAENTLCD